MTFGTKSDIQKKAMLNALEKSMGVVATACKSVGLSRNSHYRWMHEDADYKREVDGLVDLALDFAESKLHEQILGNNIAAIIFFLKTKGKVRGYVERQEVRVEQDKPDLSGYSTDQLLDLINDANANQE